MDKKYFLTQLARTIGWSPLGSCVSVDGAIVPMDLKQHSLSYTQFFQQLFDDPLISGDTYVVADLLSLHSNWPAFGVAKYCNAYDIRGSFLDSCFSADSGAVDMVIHIDDIPVHLWRTDFLNIKKGQHVLRKTNHGLIDVHRFDGVMEHPRYQGHIWYMGCVVYIDFLALIAWYQKEGREICKQADLARKKARFPLLAALLEGAQAFRKAQSLCKDTVVSLLVHDGLLKEPHKRLCYYHASDKKLEVKPTPSSPCGEYYVVYNFA